MEDYLLISGIQHFSFCRRQWALIHIENQWVDNGLTAEGKVIHERVHNDHVVTKRKDVITIRGIPIISNEWMISGQCDAIELIPDDDGVGLKGREGRWKIHPIEYKRGKPKIEDCDRLQLAAECICLEEMLFCTIETASLYYGQTRHREVVSIDASLRADLKTILTEMRGYYDRHYTPKARQSEACNSCSLADICLPKLVKKQDVTSYIKAHLNDATML